MKKVLLLSFGMAACAATAEPMRVTLTFDDTLKDHLTIAASALERRGWRGTFCVVTSCIGSGPRYLDWDDVRELVRRGHEIATHTSNHVHMARMLSAGQTNEVWRELVDSRDAIADRAGFVPRFYCPPFTDQNDATAALARRAGLEQFSVARYNFGSNNADRVEALVDELAAKGCRRVDILSHGVAQDSCGGWMSFLTAKDFEAHLDRIAAMEKAGKVIVTDYDGARSDCALKAKAWPRHGVLSLSFDDGGRNLPTWEEALPVFVKYGAAATFFFAGNIGTNEHAFAARAMQAGHEMGLHSRGHQNVDEHLAGKGPEAVESYWKWNIANQLAGFEKIGVRPRSFAYPNCRRNAETDRLFLSRGFTRLRGTPDGVKSPNPICFNLSLKREKIPGWRPVATCDEVFMPAADYLARPLIGNVIVGANYHTDIEDILCAVARAGERAEALSLVSHDIGEKPRGGGMRLDWLERILASAKDAGVVVRGVR